MDIDASVSPGTGPVSDVVDDADAGTVMFSSAPEALIGVREAIARIANARALALAAPYPLEGTLLPDWWPEASDAEYVFLRSNGCRLAQGFWFAHPVPVDEIPELASRASLIPGREDRHHGSR